MQQDSLFENLSAQTLDLLEKTPIASECFLVKIQKNQSTRNFNQLEKDQYIHTHYRLQIKLDYVLQLKLDDKKIMSGFSCHINKTFKILRSQTSDENQVGEVTGIEFRSDSFLKKNVYLYVPQDNKQFQIKNLEKFAEVLGRKYIIQDGFHDIYRAIKKIDKGVTASVYKAIRLTDQKELAVKSFKKQTYFQIDNGRGKTAFQKEFKAMAQVQSKYIVKLISVYQSENSIYMVMELLTRSLYSFLNLNGVLQVNKTKEIMKKLLIGLKDIHSQNIMHRDLKLQNIMILEDGKKIEPKIIDFGLAENWQNEEFLYVKCGTPGYVAPQILNLNSKDYPRPPYSFQCDIFSLGVIFYMLLSGKPLFDGSDERVVVKKNKDCQIDFQFKDQDKLNEEMKDLLKKMLQKDPQQRLSAEALIEHSFFQNVNLSQMESQMEV